jgi:hypothetical protein
VLRRIFRTVRWEVVGYWRRMHNEVKVKGKGKVVPVLN